MLLSGGVDSSVALELSAPCPPRIGGARRGFEPGVRVSGALLEREREREGLEFGGPHGEECLPSLSIEGVQGYLAYRFNRRVINQVAVLLSGGVDSSVALELSDPYLHPGNLRFLSTSTNLSFLSPSADQTFCAIESF